MSKRRKTQHAPQILHIQQQPEQPKKSWIELATETEPSRATPVLPRFHADLPNWTGNRKDPGSERLLGKQIWPFQGSKETNDGSTQDNNEQIIGKGRPDICACQSPGTVECVSLHVTEERNRLKKELGPAYAVWRFDEMGEDVAKTWSLRDQNRFAAMVKRNRASQNMSIVQSDWKSFRGKDRKSLISYYFNAYLPRRISKETRSGNTEVDTDDDDDAAKEHEKLAASNTSETDDDEAIRSRKFKYIAFQQSPAKDTGKNRYLVWSRMTFKAIP